MDLNLGIFSEKTDKSNTQCLDATNCLYVNFWDKNALFQAYMPHIIDGGLFIKTDKQYQLGNTIHLSITLMDEIEAYTLVCKVVWITPVNAQANQAAGIGVQFGVAAAHLRARIETRLADILNTTSSTCTL